MEKRTQELEQQARYQQSRADQREAQLKAMAGIAPQVDPLARYVEKYKADGFEDDAAKAMAKIELNSDQRFAQFQQSMQANHQVPVLMNQLTQQYSQLVRFPAALQAAHAALSDAAVNGGFAANGITNPVEYAKAIAAQVAANELIFGNGQTPATPPPQWPGNVGSQFAPSFNNAAFPQQFTPAGQTTQVPEHIRQAQEAFKTDVQNRYK